MVSQFRKGWQGQQLSNPLVHHVVMLEVPCMRVRDEDRVESGSKSRIDIKRGELPHPGVLRVSADITQYLVVGSDVLFRHNDCCLKSISIPDRSTLSLCSS